jgi:predicted double-glycine peptidase
VVGPGANLGEPALLAAPVATATALTPVRCMALLRDHFVQPDQPASVEVQSFAAAAPEEPSRVRWVGQKEASDCGVACLAMAARYHGLSVTPDEIRARTAVGQAGATLGELARSAESIGLSAHAVRVSLGQWRHVHPPAVVHLNNGHYVVLFRLDGGAVLLGDPSSGVVTVSVAHFTQAATGNALLLRPRP